MQNRTSSAPNQGNPIPDFTPVPRNRNRFDGWTPERQRALIDALADTGCVTDACKRINMAPEGAYALKRSPGASEFAAAWDAALNHGVHALADLAVHRIRHGTPVPVFYKGEQVGERRRYNERLHMFMLRNRLPEIYGQSTASAEPSGKQLAALKQQWAKEYFEQSSARREKQTKEFFTSLDRVRARLLKHAVHAPEHRAAWDLIVGGVDWDRVEAWQPDEPTQFLYDNIHYESTHLVLLQRVEEGSDVTVADMVFGVEAEGDQAA